MSQEPVYQVWSTYREVSHWEDVSDGCHWEDVSEAEYRLARDDARRLLYTAPPTADLIRELAIRECAEVCQSGVVYAYKKWKEKGIDLGDGAEHCLQAILSLIPQPSSLEDVVFNASDAGYAKDALRNEKTLGETSKEIDSIVNEVLKGGV